MAKIVADKSHHRSSQIIIAAALLGLFGPQFSFAANHLAANTHLAQENEEEVGLNEKAVGLDKVREFTNNNIFLTNSDPNITSQKRARNIIFALIKPVLNVATMLAVAAIMFGGLLYLSSLGDESRARKGKLAVVYSSIGLMIIGLSVLIINIFVNVVNDARYVGFDPRYLIFILLSRLLVPLSIIAFGAVAYGGFLYISSAGNEEQTRRGKMVLLYSGIGLALIMLSVLIVNTILRFNTL